MCGCTRAEQEGTKIESRRAYSCAVVTRLSIDYLRSARVRREQYVGEWLPEPIVTDPVLDPQEHAELSDSLSMAFLVLLERLTPSERAVLLLRDVFGYGFDEIAELIGKTEAELPPARGAFAGQGPGGQDHDSRPRSRSDGRWRRCSSLQSKDGDTEAPGQPAGRGRGDVRRRWRQGTGEEGAPDAGWPRRHGS